VKPKPTADQEKQRRSGPKSRRNLPPPRTDRPKIFCIGFHKTGTTSLKAALQVLGYSIKGPSGRGNADLAANVESIARRLVPKYDAFQDNPWPIIFPFLDREFPGSKFILTLRDSDQWIGSIVDHFGKKETKMRAWIYGPAHADPSGNEAVYVARYERHNREVIEYFKDRPGDLLVLDLSAGEAWPRICGFLGDPVPDVPFPWRNSKQLREVRTEKRAKRRKKRSDRRSPD
jgi:hypothetical protein